MAGPPSDLHISLREDLAKSLNECIEAWDNQWNGKSITFDDWDKETIELEYRLIQLKESKLSRVQRDKIIKMHDNN